MNKIIIAIAISLTGQTEELKLCNLKCTNHTKEVVIETSPDIMEDPRYYDGIESGYVLLCNGKCKGFTNHNTGEVFYVGTNGECN
tara:strand:+ start:50 stop:304 length:255 start_codon:yes stop_codon:yes gene_type:complete